MRCGLVSPSPALSAAASSMTVRPPSTLTTILPVGRRAPSFPRLELRSDEKVALRPRCVMARAQMNHGGEIQDEDALDSNHFVKEIRSIAGRSIDISTTFEGFLVCARVMDRWTRCTGHFKYM
ncbi:hypothetical protein HU200_044607 [Digitaria exilis]|uniref:Uncharacterized protein n=1 Tax=Digitaria exilis TaxID=1010633 RepID=A0A835B168_9POAL|nr:hypothetical protein HU200_044607 [Digitaria exilis]